MASVKQPSVRDRADEALGGNLRSHLGDERANGLSYADIAFRLRSDHGVVVSGESVRQWCIDLDVPEPEAAA